MKNVLVFGSTGSIGKNGLEVISRNPDCFKVLGLCAHSDIKTLKKQIQQFNPRYVCVVDHKAASFLRGQISSAVTLLVGQPGLTEFCNIDCDVSLMAITGISCLRPLVANISHAKRIALANKESIVAAAKIVFALAAKHKTEIIPVDSEINAFYQLAQLPDKKFDRVYLTASGGALRGLSKSKLDSVTVSQVLAHPTWEMGKRVTVDSATLVNKGFEAIETHCFFDLDYENIEIVIHRESAIHAMVEYADKTVFACAYPPDMKTPIAHALGFPARLSAKKGFDFKQPFKFSFEPVDYSRYPLLKIILAAAKRKDNSLVVLNACDEIAIEQFLLGRVTFKDLYKLLAWMFNSYQQAKINSLDDVLYWDNWAREKTNAYIKKHW